jgi:hypothetical protein
VHLAASASSVQQVPPCTLWSLPHEEPGAILGTGAQGRGNPPSVTVDCSSGVVVSWGSLLCSPASVRSFYSPPLTFKLNCAEGPWMSPQHILLGLRTGIHWVLDILWSPSVHYRVMPCAQVMVQGSA